MSNKTKAEQTGTNSDNVILVSINEETTIGSDDRMNELAQRYRETDLSPHVIAEELNRIESELGIEPRKIRVFRVNWAQLMREGVIFDLHIGRWRGKTRLEASDLGLSFGKEEDDKKMILLGSKLLLPPDLVREAAAIENKARRVLDKHAFKLHWGYFVLASDYQQLRQDLEEIKNEYMAVCEKIIAGYDDILEEVTKDYQVMAGVAYGRYAKLDPHPICRPAALEKADANILDESNWLTVGEYTDNVVAKILSQIPTQEQIQTSYNFNWNIGYIPLQRLLAEEETASTILRERARTERSREEAKQVQIQLDEEVARRKAAEKIRQAEAMTQAAEDAAAAKERMLRQMHADELECRQRLLRQETEQYIQAVSSMEAQFVSIIYEAAVAALDTLQNNGRLTGKNVHQLKDMIERVKGWNLFLDSPDATAIINSVESALRQKVSGGKYNLTTLQDTFRATAVVTQQMLVDLGATPRTPTTNEVRLEMAQVTPIMMRQSRQALGLLEGRTDEITPILERAGREL